VSVLILAGGKGTRLGDLTRTTPKPLINVGGRPFIFWIIDWLHAQRQDKIIISVGYLGDQIRSAVEKHYPNKGILFCQEDVPLGTGGAIKKSLTDYPSSTWLVLNGDTFCPFQLDDEVKIFENGVSSVSMVVFPKNKLQDPERYGSVLVSLDSGTVFEFREKTNVEFSVGSAAYINAGCYFLRGDVHKMFPFENSFSFERDFLEKNIGKLIIPAVFADKYFIDIGVPADLARAQNEIPMFFSGSNK
jgi:D-glycero-alpha-D-manno-heptose 1-phosphate guanylyltransferase